MRLQDLPEDILAQILTGETSIEAVGLWMTWNRQMMAKLTNGGVQELNIATLTVTKDLKWPQYLKLWKLKTLRISALDWHSTRRVGPQLRAELRQLWSGLETLEIGGPGVESAFELRDVKAAKKTASHKDPPKKKAKWTDAAADTGDWNMDATHPRLQRLKIASDDSNTKGGAPKLNFGSVALLPRSLTHLDISNTFFAIDASECVHLPPQLSTLILPSSYLHLPVINEHNIHTLPPSLTYADTLSGTGSCYTLAALMELARDEKEILPNLSVFPRLSNVMEWYNVFHVAGDRWRSNVLKMDVGYSHEPQKKPKDFVSIMPEPWSSMRTFGHSIPPSNWLLELPKTLTMLTLKAMDWKTQPSHTTWPATLTSLDLTEDLLPQAHFSSLPRNLKNLFVKATGNHPNRADFLLKGQTFLSTEQFDDYIAEVEGGGLFGLPLTLERITVSSWAPLSCGILLYPPKVRSADSFPTLRIDASALRALPPNSLTHLTIRVHDNARKPWPNSESGPETLKHSKSIKKLSLPYNSECSCENILPWIPRDLDELYIKADLSIDALSTLPQKLRILKIDSLAPSNQWAELLPRTLENLCLPQWILEGADCAKMPTLLQRLVVSVADDRPFSIEQFDALPSTLHHGLITHRAEDSDNTARHNSKPSPSPAAEIPWRLVRVFMVQFLQTQYPTSFAKMFSA